MERLKHTEIKEAKEVLLQAQNHICPLCDSDLSEVESKNIHLDHSHVTGQIRAALCSNCNRREGEIWNRANRAKRDKTVLEWLHKLIDYIDYHEENPSGIYHPKHRTETEKRELRNKKARNRRKKNKDQQTKGGHNG